MMLICGREFGELYLELVRESRSPAQLREGRKDPLPRHILHPRC
jgi:hypothetical protein